MKSKKAKWILGIALLSIPLAPISYVAIYDWQTAKRKEVALSRLKALGYPTTLEEYRRTAPRAEKNAAPLLEELIGEWRSLDKFQIFFRTPKITLQQIQLIRSNENFLVKLDQLQNYSSLWLDRDITAKFKPLFRPSRDLGFTEAQAIAMVLDARAGNHQKARSRFDTIRTLSNLLLSEGSPQSVDATLELEKLLKVQVFAIVSDPQDLRELQNWRATFIKNAPQIEARRAILPLLLEYSHSWGNLDERVVSPLELSVARLRAVQERCRALAFEEVAELAEFARDGQLTEQEVGEAYERCRTRTSDETHANLLAQFTTGEYQDVLVSRTQKDDHHRTIACLDILIEQAGGPKAVALPGVRIFRLPDRIEVHTESHRQYYVVSGGKITSRSKPDH